MSYIPILGSYLPPVVCRRAHVLFTYSVVSLFCFPSSYVPYVASFSALSIFDCPKNAGPRRNCRSISLVALSCGNLKEIVSRYSVHNKCNATH
jgi:hypothetical protein